MAGSTLSCSCGVTVEIPTLSRLRTDAGESSTHRNTVETIRQMIRDGELPVGQLCPWSGRPADDVMLVDIQCERSWVRDGDMDTRKAIAYVLCFGWIGAIIASNKSRPREECGRDTSVTVPLRISSDVRQKLLRLRRQRQWRTVLRQVPIYRQLLKEFPTARIRPASPA